MKVQAWQPSTRSTGGTGQGEDTGLGSRTRWTGTPPRACTVSASRRQLASVHVTAANACRADTLVVDMSALSRRLGGHRAARNAASVLTIGPPPDSAR